MGRRFSEQRGTKLFLVLFALAFNIAFHIPMGGISGFMILWQDEAYFLAVLLQLILVYALSASLYFFIKDV
jgi:hypothetical protein